MRSNCLTEANSINDKKNIIITK